MNRTCQVFLVIFLILACLFTAAGIFVSFIIFQQWHQPLGESLGLATPSETVDAIETPAEMDRTNTDTVTDSSTEAVEETPDATQTPSPTQPQPVCGGPPLMYILGIGVDTRDPYYLYGLADVIRIARIDFVTPKVTVLTLPRDLWVEFPGIIEQYQDTVTHGKLNQAYLFGGPGMGYYEGDSGGPGMLAHTIADNYGLYVDHYGAVNMYAFENIVDALGGIDIYLEQDWDGHPPDEDTVDLGYFTAGQHHMTGEEALRFARIRKQYSEVTRTDNQTLVICGIKDKMTQPGVIGSLPELVKSFLGMVQTDLSIAQITQLICLLSRLDSENLQFVRFPDDMMVQGREFDPHHGQTVFVWDIPIDYIRAFLRDFENDAIPPDVDGGMTCPE